MADGHVELRQCVILDNIILNIEEIAQIQRIQQRFSEFLSQFPSIVFV